MFTTVTFMIANKLSNINNKNQQNKKQKNGNEYF